MQQAINRMAKAHAPKSHTANTSKSAAATQREVRFGHGKLDVPMTIDQAKKWGERHMPQDLKKAGFTTVIFESDPELHGGLWYRINFGKNISMH